MQELERNPLTRRDVLGAALASGLALSCSSARADDAIVRAASGASSGPRRNTARATLVGSTNALAGMKLHYEKLLAGGDPLDVAIEVVKVTEADPNDESVGLGGLPNEEGVVQLDAAVMYGPRGKGGAVAALENILHPCEVARLVMERTRHIMLVGEAADAFAAKHGQPARDLVAPAARAAWEAWRAHPNDAAAGQQTRDSSLLRPVDTGDPSAGALFGGAGVRGEQRWQGHDTIGSIALGCDGRLAGACSTSGTPYKVPGRVGDSPIIGHGLYVDPSAGAATATGSGELIMGVCGAFLAVECMRRGASPKEAAQCVVERIGSTYRIEPHHQTAFIVVAPDGQWSSAALRGGFLAACRDERGARLVPAEFVLRAD